MKSKEREAMKKEIPVQQGKKYEITIQTLGTSGEGVGRMHAENL